LQHRQEEPKPSSRVQSIRKLLNSLLQNQKTLLRALSSKAASLLGKFAVAEPVRDCVSHNKKWAASQANPRLIPGGGNSTASFLVPTVTALHEQTLDVDAQRQALLWKQ
jgi:hypothetical protein